MINTETVTYIDVPRVFFDVEMVQTRMRWYLFEDESDGKISMNYVISKPYAIDKAIDCFKSQKNRFSTLTVSEDAIKVKYIKDYMGEPILKDLDGELSGWLFLFDTMPFANWDHPCKYLFVIDAANYQEIESDRGITGQIRMEKVY